MSTEHPSFLALDRHHLARRPANDVEAHVATCARCTEHLREMEQGAALPAALRARAEGPRIALAPPLPNAVRPSRVVRIAWQGSFALAALFIAVVSVRSIPSSETTRTKGNPGVEVFIKRRAAPAFIWDGMSALHAGDAIRLRAIPSGFARVSVWSTQSQLLWSTQFLDNQPVLSDAWELDAEATTERLRVVFSHAPWTWQSFFGQDFALELTLPKDTAP